MVIENGFVTTINSNKSLNDHSNEIASDTFFNNASLTSKCLKKISLPDGLLEIDEYAFQNLSDVEIITIPNSVTKIGERSFSNCKLLKSVTLPNGITEIAPSTFNGCESLEHIIIPNRVKKIGYRAFADCKNLKDIIIPESVKSIDWGCFSGCESLVNIVIPKNIEHVGHQLFLNCGNLESVYIPNHISTIPRETFKGCRNLTYISNLDYINHISEGGFEGCRSLKVAPNTVLSMGEGAFKNCSSFTSFIVNEGITNLPPHAFKGCTSLTNIISNSSSITLGKGVFSGCTSLQEIPSSVVAYGEYAFDRCISLKKVKIINKVIPTGAFRGCSGIVEFSNTNTITSMDRQSFKGCNRITHFELGDEINSIPVGAFSKCSSLELIAFPNSLKSINTYAFLGCEKLNNVTFPDSLTTIGKQAFWGCNTINSIHIPKSVTKIDSAAFANMNSLASISVEENSQSFTSIDNLMLIDNDIQRINQYAVAAPNKTFSVEKFTYNIEMMGREIISPIHGIDDYAFFGAKNLEELTLSSSADRFEINTFANCPNLKTLNVKILPFYSSFGFRPFGSPIGTIFDCPFEVINIGDGVGILEIGAFLCMPNIKSLRLPFFGCTYIKRESFINASELKEVYIPAEIVNIDNDTFHKNTLLVFQNGLKIKSENLVSVHKRDDVIIFELIGGNYILEKYGALISISVDDIKRSFVNSDQILKYPYKILNYLELIYANNCINSTNDELIQRKAFITYLSELDSIVSGDSNCLDNNLLKLLNKNKLVDNVLLDGILISSLSLENAKIVINDFGDELRYVLLKSRVLEASTFSEKLLKTPQVIVDFCNIFKKYNIKDPYILDQNFMVALTQKQIEMIASVYNTEIKEVIIKSNVVNENNNFKVNMSDLLTFMELLGCFYNDAVIRQRANKFLVEKIFDEKSPSGEDNPYRLVGDDIHRVFNKIKPKEHCNLYFTKFFLENYKELIDTEKSKSGTIQRIYDNFERIKSTCTSDRGEQRQLKVTVSKCLNYLSMNKFNNITPENKHIADAIGEWFDSQIAFDNSIRMLQEAKMAPRNIFTKYEDVLTRKKIKRRFDNDPINDLKEEINPDFSYEWLPKQALENVLLGKYCSCCAHVNGAGMGIARASMISPDCQNLVVRNQNGDIIAKSTIYVNREQGYAVYNTVESNMAHRALGDLNRIYQAFLRGTEAFINVYNTNNTNQLKNVNVGSGRNTIINILSASKEHPSTIVLPTINYAKYKLDETGGYLGDSQNSQILVLSAKKQNI